MATEKDVEKAQERVAKLRTELADKRASVATTSEQQNEVYIDQLKREEDVLRREIAEIEADKSRQHKDAANPLAFAEAILVRDEIVPDRVDDKTTNAAATTGKEK